MAPGRQTGQGVEGSDAVGRIPSARDRGRPGPTRARVERRFRMRTVITAAVLITGVCACEAAAPPSASPFEADLPEYRVPPETHPPAPAPVRRAETPFARAHPRARVLRIPAGDTMARDVVGTLPDGRLIVRKSSRRLPYLDHVDLFDPATGRSALLQRTTERESYTAAAAAHGTRVVKLLGNDEPGGWILEATDLRTGLTREVMNTWGGPAGYCGRGWPYPVDLVFHRGDLYFSACVSGDAGDVGVYRMGPGDEIPRLWRRGLYDIVWEGDAFLAKSPVLTPDSADPGDFTGSPARYGPDGTRRGVPDPASYIVRVDEDRDLLEYGDGTAAGIGPRARGVAVSRHGRFAVWREGGTGWLLDARTRTAVRLPGRAVEEVGISHAGYLQWRTAGVCNVVDLAVLNDRD
ncbi:hypothetical protein HS048_29105 [Planomonospora sp. ID91781]|uniref:hypothetical protein n=1 Tax=Planomonospora sp. ID91781 TaxID=2738135 RepID=UPI0018C3C20F|nr:hypothetical protein [Planomonospora sp. ID91781]MBG0824766.1 hypothetical protein [Planomonospora sp. ID91781]